MGYEWDVAGMSWIIRCVKQAASPAETGIELVKRKIMIFFLRTWTG